MASSYVGLLTTDNYLPGILVVAECLRRTGSRYPFHVCITDKLSRATRKILRLHKIPTIEVGEITVPKLNRKHRWFTTFTKLHVFSLTQFKKIVYIDADMLICSNLDHLFDKPHLSAVNAGGLIEHTWKGLNSGLMVISPEAGAVERMMAIVSRDGIDKFNGDQCVINAENPTWPDTKTLHLDHTYNMPHQHVSRVKKDHGIQMIRSLGEMFRGKGPANLIKVIHFWAHTGAPWDVLARGLTLPPGDIGLTYRLWIQLYQEIIRRGRRR